MKKRIFIDTFVASYSVLLAIYVLIAVFIYVNGEDALENSIALGKISSYLASFMLLSAVITFIVAFVVSLRLSKNIITPIEKIDILNPDKNVPYKELRSLNDQIMKKNRQTALQLEKLKLDHEKQDKRRREFTANVSHELKTPLTSISGYAEIMRDGMVKPEDIQRFSGKIYDESRRLITLVGDIIKLSQLDDKEIKVKMEKINLYDCVNAVISHLAPLAEKKDVKITLSGEKCVINGVEQIVEEIIYNVCDNAIKYNKDGGKVDITIKQCVDGTEVSVSDTGIGIPKEDLEHIFERFYRVNKSHSRQTGGTGLGLSIVKHAAMFHNAYVSVESELDKGTTVRILF